MNTLETIIAIMAFLILAFVTSIPLFENYKKYSFFKRIYITVAVILLFIIGSFDVYLKCTDPSETDKVLGALKKLESIIGIKSKNPLPKIDTDKSPIAAIKNSPPKKSFLSASLRISSISTGFTPILTKTDKDDSVIMDYKIINKGPGDACNIKISSILLKIANNKAIAVSKMETNSYDPSLCIYPSKTDGQTATTLIKLPLPLIDSTFVCLKIDFSDSTKKRKALTRVFQINHNPLYLKEVTNILTSSLSNFLIANKYWKQPFKQ